MGKEILSHCRMTVSEEVKWKGFEPMVVAITGAGFKIISVSPLVIEKDSTSKDDLVRLADLLTSLGETQECSTNTTTTPAGNKIFDNSPEKKEGISGSTTEGRSSAVKVNTPASEVKVEDYVMKKHQFHLAGEYFKDRDWKELFGKAQEIDEGFRFRGVDVSADECHLLEILKKIAFETIGIPDGEAHRVGEAAEDMNCVDHGVCVIDYDSRPYLVGPKAQVHAAKEEIISQLEHEGIHCQWTVPTTPSMTDDSKDKNQSNDTVHTTADDKKVENVISSSDEESSRIEYVMKKIHFRLAKEYFSGCPEHQYFDKAKEIEEGLLFSFSNKNTAGVRFLKSLRSMQFGRVGHCEEDKAKVNLIAEQLKCKDLGVRVIELGPKSFLVGPKEKIAELQQKFISKLQENQEAANSLNSPENSVSQRSQHGMREYVDSSSRSVDLAARPKRFVGMESSFDKNPINSKCAGAATSRSSFQGPVLGSGSTVDQSFLCGICIYVKKSVKPTSCCGKLLCKDCVDRVSACPYCTKQWRISTGNQPDGPVLGSGSTVDQSFLCGICIYAKKSVKPTSCCGKLLCKDCADRVPFCPYCRKQWRISTGNQTDGKGPVLGSGSTVDQSFLCGICIYAKKSVKPTSCCGKLLCKDCADRVPFCPYCRKQWRISTGNQTDGKGQVPGGGSKVDQSLECGICFAEDSVQPTSCCRKPLCKECVDRVSACPYCRKQWRISTGNQPDGKGQVPGGGSKVDQSLECGICFAEDSVQPTSCCSKPLCKKCVDRVLFCPYCCKQWRNRTGNQPRGYMTVNFTRESADGFDSKGSWTIEYSFPPGAQTSQHPNPGQLYQATRRTAYIPALEDSMELLKLLRLAFIRRLTFTIGKSQTTGQDNRIVWNGISHKTSLHGAAYGFPDPSYFKRVCQELKDKGVTIESMTEAEILSIARFEQSLNIVKFFSDRTS